MKVKLRDVSNIIMGQSPDSSTYNTENIGLPFFQGNADFGELNPIAKTWCSAPIKIAYKNYILISVRAPIGALNIAAETCCIGRGLAALDVNNKICTQKYLWYLLEAKKNELISKGTGSTFKAISKNILSEMEFNIPPVREQELCTKTLDVVFCLIRLKKEQLDKLDLLVKSRFIEMFGENKSKNHFGKLSDVCLDIIAGGDRPNEISYEQTEEYCYPVFANARTNNGLLYYAKSYKIASKAVTIAARGATVGFTAIRDSYFTPIVRLITLIPNESMNVYYMKYYIDYNLRIVGSGSAQPQLTVPYIKNLKILIPTSDMQNQFASLVMQVDKSKLAIQQSLDELETLKKSLMQQYFG